MTIKNTIAAALLVVAAMLASCKNSGDHQGQNVTLQQYFNDPDSLKTGGVQVIPINTPKGKFKIWTKKFGNNPKIKLLLLNGGPSTLR